MSRHGSLESALRGARSALFVPGDRPDRFDKACAAGPDAVILDLEDAVAEDHKRRALDLVVGWLKVAAPQRPAVIVRINPPGTVWHAAEVDALHGCPTAVMVPKAESAHRLVEIAQALGGARLVALMETPKGVLAAEQIAAVPAVARLALGNVDLAVALGVSPTSRPALAFARGQLTHASAAAGLTAPFDGVTTSLTDDSLLEDDLRYAREVGFRGKLCLHPRQVGASNALLSPSVEEISWARRVLSLAGEGVVAIDGEMIDKPVIARARALLDRLAGRDSAGE